MKYTIRVLHYDTWGPTGIVTDTRKEAEKFLKWGYSHYPKHRIVEATKASLEKYVKCKTKGKKRVRV